MAEHARTAGASLLLYAGLCELCPPFAWLILATLCVAPFVALFRFACREPWRPELG